MVSCKLFQQIGNQNFQIAVTIATAKKHGYDYCIPTKTTSGHPTHEYKNVNYGNVELPIHAENEKIFNAIPNMDNICLRGYWQDYNYFWDYLDDIREALALPYKMIEGRVAIHVRLTDGYENRQDYFPRVSLDYVRNGIEYFKNLGYADFKVFSDNQNWTKENITSEKFNANISYSENQHPIEDFVEQSEHEHQIIANSTFSAWAAYLNQNPNKIIVRPEFFLGKKLNHLHKNIYRPEWITKSNQPEKQTA